MTQSTDSPNQRHSYSAQTRAELLQEQDRSGLSVAKFTVQRGIGTSTFHSWRRKARAAMKGRKVGARNSAFRQMDLGQVLGASPWAGEINLPDGTSLRWNGPMTAELLHQLVARLRRSC